METLTYTLKDISLNICDGVHNTVIDDENGDCLLLSAKNIQGGRIVFDENTDRKINRELCNKLKKRTKLSKNDIAITTVGANVGDLAIVGDGSENYEFQRSVGIIKANTKIADPIFLFYLLGTNSFNYYFHVIATGSAQPCLFLGTLNKIKVQLPPLSTQQKIASILSAYDNLIQNYKKQIEALQTAASELYKEWFVRFRFPGYQTTEFENGIPKGWKYSTLNEVANIIMGQSPESCYYNEEKKGLPFHQGAGGYGELYLIDDIYSTEGLRIAEPGSIIFSVRAPVGKLNLTLNKIILGRGVAAINSKSNNNGFLFWSLKSKFSKEDMIGNGAVFASVTKDELLKQKLLIPSTSILNQYDKNASDIEKRIRALYLQITNLTQQRDLLLPRLMSGKLEVE